MPNKPLSEDEIDGLRRWAAGFPFGDLLGAAVLRLLDEATRARALLKRIEWGGTQIIEDDSEPCCPECREWPHHGHAAGCELAALIGKG